MINISKLIFICPKCKKQYERKKWFDQHLHSYEKANAVYSGGQLFYQSDLTKFIDEKNDDESTNSVSETLEPALSDSNHNFNLRTIINRLLRRNSAV